jgi:hypothetical protein
MSNAEYSLLEYSYNPNIVPEFMVEDRLADLGFTKRTSNGLGSVSLFTQNLCIMLVRRCESVAEVGITGIGLSTDIETINRCGAEFDEITGTYVRNLGPGMRILMLAESQIKNFGAGFSEQRLLSNGDVRGNHLTYVSGVITGDVDRYVKDFMQDELGFKFTKSGERYNVFMSPNNRFTMLMDKEKPNTGIRTVVADTDDVFMSTACFAANSFSFKKFEMDNKRLQFGKMNHKIVGYNCWPEGNENSYTIENLVLDAAEGIDLIIRQRKQYLHIGEETLDKYYESSAD